MLIVFNDQSTRKVWYNLCCQFKRPQLMRWHMLDDAFKQKVRSSIEEYHKGKTKEEINWLYFLFVERFEPKLPANELHTLK